MNSGGRWPEPGENIKVRGEEEDVRRLGSLLEIRRRIREGGAAKNRLYRAGNGHYAALRGKYDLRTRERVCRGVLPSF
jgi:hypothetical protein